MTTEMLLACNKVKAELQTERFNQRMIHIARCFEYDKFIGVDVRSLKTDRLYYNHYFDMLMDMNLEDLEAWEVKIFKITKDYGEAINRYGTE